VERSATAQASPPAIIARIAEFLSALNAIDTGFSFRSLVNTSGQRLALKPATNREGLVIFDLACAVAS
jgi:hypothetical protein